MAGNTGSGRGTRCSRWRIAAWSGGLLLLLLPAVAMRVTDQVAWDLADFVLFGALLLAAGSAFELAARRSSDACYLAGAAVAVAGAFVLAWMNLAVGFIGDEGNAANRLVGVVLVVGITGAAIARLRPNGMARAMLATAIAQAVIGLAAVAGGFGSSALPTGFFTVLWLSSAWLFARAGRGA